MSTSTISIRARSILPTGGLQRLLRERAVQLAALALVSLGVYLFAFVLPYGLRQWWSRPFQTIRKMTNNEPGAGAAYLLAVLALFLLYGLACRAAKGRQGVAAWGAVITGAMAFNAAMLWLYPVGAADIFDYIIRARMQALYGANPFYQAPVEFKDDLFHRYNAWDYVPSAYGPGWELIAAVAARVAGDPALMRDNVIGNVLTFKMVSVLAYAGAAALIGLTLRRTAPERALHSVTLFAWNPLVIYATAGNGHNDAVMVFFIVLGFYWLARGRFTLAALAQTAGALIKFVPALLVPIVMVAALKRLKGWRARTGYVLLTLSACALLAAAVYAPFWRGGDMLSLERRGEMFTTSLPSLLQVTLQPGFDEEFAEALATRAALVLLGAWLIRQLRAVWRSKKAQAAAHAGLSVLLFYLLVSVPWFQAWYVVWPLALASLLPDGSLVRGTVLLSFAATWNMPLFDYVLKISNENLPPRIWREWRITLGTLGVPWAYFVARSRVAKVRAGR